MTCSAKILTNSDNKNLDVTYILIEKLIHRHVQNTHTHTSRFIEPCTHFAMRGNSVGCIIVCWLALAYVLHNTYKNIHMIQQIAFALIHTFTSQLAPELRLRDNDTITFFYEVWLACFFPFTLVHSPSHLDIFNR